MFCDFDIFFLNKYLFQPIRFISVGFLAVRNAVESQFDL